MKNHWFFYPYLCYNYLVIGYYFNRSSYWFIDNTVWLFKMNDFCLNQLYSHLSPSAWHNLGSWNLLSNGWCETKLHLNSSFIISDNACHNCIRMELHSLHTGSKREKTLETGNFSFLASACLRTSSQSFGWTPGHPWHPSRLHEQIWLWPQKDSQERPTDSLWSSGPHLAVQNTRVLPEVISSLWEMHNGPGD